MDIPLVMARRTAPEGSQLTGARARVRAGYLGIASGVVFVLTTAAGSILDPTYSQIRQHASDLTATRASTYAALAPFYLLYNVLTAAFAVRLGRRGLTETLAR